MYRSQDPYHIRHNEIDDDDDDHHHHDDHDYSRRRRAAHADYSATASGGVRGAEPGDGRFSDDVTARIELAAQGASVYVHAGGLAADGSGEA